MDTDEGLYHAKPQTKGKSVHETIDKKTASNSDLLSLPVYSEKYRLMGKIDIYRQKEKLLIERKYQLRKIYQGQIYQLWAQYLCMTEMGYEISQMAFYETSTNKIIPVPLPTDNDIEHFYHFIERFRHFNPAGNTYINPNKCRHCIYCNLCHKTEEENVYQ